MDFSQPAAMASRGFLICLAHLAQFSCRYPCLRFYKRQCSICHFFNLAQSTASEPPSSFYPQNHFHCCPAAIWIRSLTCQLHQFDRLRSLIARSKSRLHFAMKHHLVLKAYQSAAAISMTVRRNLRQKNLFSLPFYPCYPCFP